MPPRFLSFVALAILLSAGSAHSADRKKASSKKSVSKPTRTWKTVVDHAWKAGTDWPIKAPSTKTLGFDADEIKTRGVSIDDDKSQDGREHAVKVIYENDHEGNPQPKEVSLSVTKVKEENNLKYVEGYQMRVTMTGELICGMRAKGVVGSVEQMALTADSKELLSVFKSERDLYLKKIDLAQLTP